MTRGVMYFTVGNSHLERLIVSLSSLRQHEPDLPVTVVAEQETTPEWLESEVALYGASVIRMQRDQPKDSALTTKIASLQYAPYDLTFFMDADTLVVAPIQDAFDLGDNDFGFVNFAGWKTSGKTITKRINSWQKVGTMNDVLLDAAKRFGPAINVGTFVFRKGHPFLTEWRDATRLGAACRIFIPDEVYAQAALPTLKAQILGPEWGVSVRYGKREGAKIIHYHGDKHSREYPMCKLWEEQRNRIELGHNTASMTVVVAVDAGYWKTFERSYRTWVESKLLSRDKHLLHIVTDGSVLPEQIAELVKYPHTVSEYHGTPEMTQRERMITAFVKHVPYLVKTPFWIKLDADCRCLPGTKLFRSQVWQSYDIVSHRWGYTKPAKWLIQLEEWRVKNQIGQQVIDPATVLPEATRHRHSRIQSFACLHRTSASVRMSDLVKEDRLPVPSHDTFYFFAAKALGLKIKALNLKGWGFQH